jgi:CarD family transcriptional regulator
MLKLLNHDEAVEIIQSFKIPGTEWIVDVRQRNKEYRKIVNTGNRKEIAKIANTLMRNELELNLKGKKVYDQDRMLLKSIQDLLFNEIASAMDTTVEEVFQKVYRMIKW